MPCGTRHKTLTISLALAMLSENLYKPAERQEIKRIPDAVTDNRKKPRGKAEPKLLHFYPEAPRRIKMPPLVDEDQDAYKDENEKKGEHNEKLKTKSVK